MIHRRHQGVLYMRGTNVQNASYQRCEHPGFPRASSGCNVRVPWTNPSPRGARSPGRIARPAGGGRGPRRGEPRGKLAEVVVEQGAYVRIQARVQARGSKSKG
eukprot:1184622-Prorocentrum_minimum.AAC.2